MVAPLDVHIVIGHQGVHDNIGAGTAVKDVADDVEMIHGKTLNNTADSNSKSCCLSGFDDGIDDIFVVIPLVGFLVAGVEQLVDHIGKVLGQCLSHLGAGIGGGDQTADIHQPVEGNLIPLVHIGNVFMDQFQLFFGVVDQGCQLIPVVAGKAGTVQIVQLFLYDTGTRVQNVQKGFIFAVDIGDEVLRAFGEIQNCLQVDEFRAGCLNRGILFCQQLQILQFFRGECYFGSHVHPPFFAFCF